MKGKIMMILLLAATLIAGSCQRRDFAERTTGVNLILKINTQIVNHNEHTLPETMRVDLYNMKTGKIAYTDYVGPTGGYIHPVPGDYDLVLYNIGTESTQVRNEYDFNQIEAFTSEVSAFLKGQLAQFLASVAKSKAERAQTKAPVEETIVYEPDHLFVGMAHGVNIPVRYEGEEDLEVVIEVDAHTVVETWKVSVPNVIGLEYVRDVVALMSGQVESHFIGKEEKSGKSVSVFFEMYKDMENNALVGRFNTFGKHPSEISFLDFDINVTDTGGEEHHFHFDVDSQFMDNPDNHIQVEEQIEVEEPKTGGGGFDPSVEDWEDVRTDINL